MRLRLLSDGVWARLTELARRPNRSAALVAVPYLGAGAAKRLPLRRGDLLVARFDDVAFACGLVDPREVVKYLRRGVEVHAVGNLHAKVFVLGKTAVVGSTNVSTHSADHLVEAACESDGAKFVASARRFVKSLRGDLVGLEFAKLKIPLYRPPRPIGARAGGGNRRRPQQSSIAAVMLELVDYEGRDRRIEQESIEKARAELEDPAQYTVAGFLWTGSVPVALQRGARVIQCTRLTRRSIVVAAPARILSIRRYRDRRGAPRAWVIVEIRKGARKRTLSSIVSRVPAAAVLRQVVSCRHIRDADLVSRLGQLWSRSK